MEQRRLMCIALALSLALWAASPAVLAGEEERALEPAPSQAAETGAPEGAPEDASAEETADAVSSLEEAASSLAPQEEPQDTEPSDTEPPDAELSDIKFLDEALSDDVALSGAERSDAGQTDLEPVEAREAGAESGAGTASDPASETEEVQWLTAEPETDAPDPDGTVPDPEEPSSQSEPQEEPVEDSETHPHTKEPATSQEEPDETDGTEGPVSEPEPQGTGETSAGTGETITWLVPQAELPDETAQDGAAPADAMAEEPLIDVTVPADATVTINPHRLPVELDGKTIYDQVVNEGQLLTNSSKIPIEVGASVSVRTPDGSSLAIADAPIRTGEKEKLAFLYVEFHEVADAESEPVWSGQYTGGPDQLIATVEGTGTEDLLRLEAGDETPTYIAYRLFGSLSDVPQDPWIVGDGVSVTVSFTFRPAEGAGAAEPAAETEPETETKTETETETEPEPEPEPEPAPIAEAPEAVSNAPGAATLSEAPTEDPTEASSQETRTPERSGGDGVASLAEGLCPDWLSPPDLSGAEEEKERS